MTRILFIASDDSIPQHLREVFSTPGLKWVTKAAPGEARSALQAGAFDVAVVYEVASAESLTKKVRELRQMAKNLMIAAILGRDAVAVDEVTVFEAGADLFFSEPLPAETLRRILGQRNSASSTTAMEGVRPAPAAVPPVPRAASALHILRDFSNILGFSLDHKAFTQHFILKLREHISFSRIGIFIEGFAKQSFVRKEDPVQLECVASLGLPADLIECFQLSREVGIGASLADHPKILNIRSGAIDARAAEDYNIKKEFGILGCHLAVPISDRERCVGVAVLNGPVTGRDYSEDELQLLYLLMEELGLAIRNSRLHSELSRHGELIENVLKSMASGAIVVSENLDVLYANPAARRFLALDTASSTPVEWAELPSTLAGPVYKAVEKGEILEPFQIREPDSGRVFRVSIIPFSKETELPLLPRPIMVIIEDFTKIEASKQNALDKTKSDLLALIAERFAHEIRNSLVPLSTHAQLLDKKIEQPAFQASLKSAMIKETGRIKRFSEQMLYLAQQNGADRASAVLQETILEAFERAKAIRSESTANLELRAQENPIEYTGNIEAITYALEEILLNSLQAQPPSGTVCVSLHCNDEGIIHIRILDEGPGFDEETVEKAFDPFFTTRNTGVGLGLSVAKKIFEDHSGVLRLNQKSEANDWDVDIQLPLTT